MSKLVDALAASEAADQYGTQSMKPEVGQLREEGVPQMPPPEHFSKAATQLGYNENDQKGMIQDYLKNGGQNLNPQQTAWCAAFVGSTLQQSGIEGTGSNMAKSYLNWGTAVDNPQVGDVAIFSRGDPSGPSGHVGFYAGEGPKGIKVLGGNQGDSVSYANYPQNRLLGYRRAGDTPDVRMASADLGGGGMTTGSTNPMNVTGDPVTGQMDLPFGKGETMDPELLEYVTGQKEKPKSFVQEAINNPLVQIGMNILSAPGNYGDWAGAIGTGVTNATKAMNQQQQQQNQNDLAQAKLRQQMMGKGGQDRTSMMQNYQYIKQQEQAGRMAPGTADAFMKQQTGQSEPGISSTAEKWAEYNRILENKGQAAADKYYQLAGGAQSPDQVYQKKLSETEGKDLPSLVRDSALAVRDADQSLMQIDKVQGDLANLFGMTDVGTTGWGKMFASLPTSDAKSWRNLRDTITSNIALGEMKKLKAMSAQGATGFGAMNEKELSLLLDNIQKLDQSDDPKVIKENIKKIFNNFENYRDQVNKSREAELSFYEGNREGMRNAPQYEFGEAPARGDYWKGSSETPSLMQQSGSAVTTPLSPISGGASANKRVYDPATGTFK